MGNALAALSAVDPSSISASLFGNVTASPLSNAALDQSCLAQCGLTSAGGSLNNLSADLQVTHLPQNCVCPELVRLPSLCDLRNTTS